ncbi:hypothetical protein FJZ19_06165 [Candidatus Pacearchaeota archaeon]|nr:hypothetical protein [Candidatus Pacearchaeota archaeon]
MAFGKLFGIEKRRIFKTKPDNYETTNKYYFSDGSGEYSWQSFYSATGKFYDDFGELNLIDTWNTDSGGIGSASAANSVLSVTTGAAAGSFYCLYSIFKTKTLREAGTITFECRMKKNLANIGANNPRLFIGFARDYSPGDDDFYTPSYYFGGTAGVDFDANEIACMINGNQVGADAVMNDGSYYTLKIVLDDYSRTIKFYINGSLITSSSNPARDTEFLVGLKIDSVNTADEQTMGIAWVKVTD